MSQISKISAEIATLAQPALADTQSMLARYGLGNLLRDTPVIEVYDSAEELAHERRFHDVRRALGFRIDEISGRDAADLEPALAKDFACGVVFRDWCSVADPKRYVVALHQAFLSQGGTVHPVEGQGFTGDGNSVTGVRTGGGAEVCADQIVVAAGAWSKTFAAEMGLKIQLEGVIGYQTSLSAPDLHVNHSLIYAACGFGITPYESGLAVAGSIEFAGLGVSANWKRAEILVKKARRVLPGLRTSPAERRFGRRPLTPDTKPIIGLAPKERNVIFATGHGQLGLTLGATTALLVSDIIAGRTPRIEMAPFRPDRFQ